LFKTSGVKRLACADLRFNVRCFLGHTSESQWDSDVCPLSFSFFSYSTRWLDSCEQAILHFSLSLLVKHSHK
jgi:hypothetical protein